MWIPEEIAIKGFLVFREKQVYKFNQGVCTLIQGINESDEGAESNGSGKSSLLQAISFLIRGTSIRDVLDKELINWDCDSSELYLRLRNSRDSRVLEIQRTLSIKSSSTLDIKVNTVSQRDKYSSVKEGNKFLLDLIGITAEDMQSYYIINRLKYKSFFRSSDDEKKEFIGRFSKGNLLLPIFTNLSQKREDLSSKRSTLLEDQVKLSSKIEVYEEQIQELEKFDYTQKSKEFEEEDKGRQIEIEESIAKIREVKKLRSREFLSLFNDNLILRNTESLLSKQITKLESISYEAKLQDLNASRKKFDSEVKLSASEIENKKELYTEIKTGLNDIILELQEVITCPKCKYQFKLSLETVDVEELKELEEECRKSLVEIEEFLENKKSSIDEIKTKKLKPIEDKIKEFDSKISRVDTLLDKCRKELVSIKRVLTSSNSNLIEKFGRIKAEGQSQINLRKELHSLKETAIATRISNLKEEHSAKLSELREKIKNLEEELEDIKGKVLQKDEELLKNQSWEVNFKRFYSHLTNRSLMSIQGYSNNFLKKMGTNLQLQLEGFKTLASGEVREKISANLLRNGIVEGPVNCGSTGEQSKIECSVIVSNQTIINNSCKSGGLDLLIIDEVLDGTDGVGMQSLISSMQSLNKTILLITHITPKYLPDYIMKIKKVKGESYILGDE